MHRTRTLATILVLTLSAPAFGADDSIPSLPEDFSKVTFYLLTIGRGSDPAGLFGHTLIRVTDESSKTDYNFNWGTFTYEDPSFLLNFYRGFLRYQLTYTGFPAVKRQYMQVENRSIVQDRIVLTNKQKETFMQHIIRNLQPDNLHYMYDFLNDNCATRPRDYLDEALDGRIKAAFGKLPAPETFRDHIRRGMSNTRLIQLGSDLTLNSVVDRTISRYEEMFLPAKLRGYLLNMKASDDEGRTLPDQPLLDDSQTIFRTAEPRPVSNPYALLVFLLGFPMIWGTLLVGLRLARNPDTVRTLHRIGYRAFGVGAVAWSLLSGLLGIVMASNWLFSEHLILHHNANLLVFWPVDWLLLGYAVRLIASGGPVPRSSWLFSLATHLSWLHLVGIVIFVIYWFTGVFIQDVDRVVLFIVPLAFLFYWMIARREIPQNRAT